MTKRRTRFWLVLAFGIIAVVGLYGQCRRLLFGIPREHLTREFLKNVDRFTIIASFLKDSDDQLFIERDGNGYVTNISVDHRGLRATSITAPDVDKSIRYLLFRLHYEYINEDEGINEGDGNGIYFTLEDTGWGFCHGVAFSKDGRVPDGWGMALRLVTQLQGNWYYFEGE